jgi:hypothetical protein
MSDRLDLKKKLLQRTECVKAVDLHPTEPWVLSALHNGKVLIHDIETQKLIKTIDVCQEPVRTARFITKKKWVITGSDDLKIRVFNYNTCQLVHQFEAHVGHVRNIAIHPTKPLIITSSDDKTARLWNWEKNFNLEMTFGQHAHSVMNASWSPVDSNIFATSCLDGVIRIWNINGTLNYSLRGHTKGVNWVDWYQSGDKPFLISGSEDTTVIVWNYQTKSQIQKLTAHSRDVTCCCFHPKLPLIITGAEDHIVAIYHAHSFQLLEKLDYRLERVWSLGIHPSNTDLAIGYDFGTAVIELGKVYPKELVHDNKGRSRDAHDEGKLVIHGFKHFNTENVDDASSSMRKTWNAPKEFLEEAAQIMEKNAEDPFAKYATTRVADREDSYKSRWRKRQLSPDRYDPFSASSSANKDSSEKRSYAEIYKEHELDRQKSELLQKLKKKEEKKRHRAELEKQYGKELVDQVFEEQEKERKREEEEQKRKRFKSTGQKRVNEKVKEEKNEVKKEIPILKEGPNFNLSGKLAASQNTTEKGVVLKWTEPPEARLPVGQKWRLYIMKDEQEVEKPIKLYNQKSYLFGRDRDTVDIPTDHPSCSKQHAAICFRAGKDKSGDKQVVKPFLIDLKSTNGTLLNGKKIEDSRYYELIPNDIIQFGHSTREYILINEDQLNE